MSRRRKFCKSCVGKYHFDYKDARFLSQFISDNGRIVPRRISGACAQCQRKITLAVKRARHLALLPYVRR